MFQEGQVLANLLVALLVVVRLVQPTYQAVDPCQALACQHLGEDPCQAACPGLAVDPCLVKGACPEVETS